MSEHQEKLERIMECVNRETEGIELFDRFAEELKAVCHEIE